MLLTTNPRGLVMYEVSSRCEKKKIGQHLLTFWFFRGKYREKHGQKKASNRNMGPFFNIRNRGVILGREIA